MADWSLPTITSLYTSVLSELDGRLDDCATLFNGSTSTNIPTGTFRVNGTSSNLLQKWNGSAWGNESLSVQTLKIGADSANSESTVTDLLLGGSSNIASMGNLNFYIDSDNNATTAKFTWNKNSGGLTGATKLMELAEDGTLSVGNSSGNAGIIDIYNTTAGYKGTIRGTSAALSLSANAGGALYLNYYSGDEIIFGAGPGIAARITNGATFYPASTGTGSVGTSGYKWGEGHFDALFSDGKQVVAGSAVVTGHTKAGNVQILNGVSAPAGTYVSITASSASTSVSYGGASSGADVTSLTYLDNIPSTARILKVMIRVQLLASSYFRLYAMEGDVTYNSANNNQLIEVNSTSASVDEYCIEIPLSSLKVFTLYYTTNGSPSVSLTCKGFIDG